MLQSPAIASPTPSAWGAADTGAFPYFEPIEAHRSKLLFFLMGVYIFFLPVQFENAALNLAPSDLALALALVLCLGRLRWVAGAWSRLHAALVLMFLVGTFLSISDFGAATPYTRVKLAGLLALFAGYLCLTSAAADWPDLRSLLRIFVGSVTLHVVIALVALETGWTVAGLNYGNVRLSGMLIDPNAFGGLVAVALILQGVTQEGGQGIVKGIPGLLVTATLALGLALTYSRSAWIGLGFGLTVAAIYRWRLTVAWALFVVAGAIGVWMAVENPDPSLGMVERANTAEQRLDQINEALPIFARNPILGAGIGGFYNRVTDPQTGGPRIIHNTTVWILTDLGLVGVSVYLGFLAWFFFQGAAALRVAGPQYKPLILALLCGHACMIGLSTGIEALYQRHWWFDMALLAAGCSLIQRQAAHQALAGAESR